MKQHPPFDCVISELQLFGNSLSWDDFDDVEEICMQVYMDALGHGINVTIRKMIVKGGYRG